MFQKIKDGEWSVVSTALEHGQTLTFDDMISLKEAVDEIVARENSRLLSESLMGDIICDTCTI